MKYEQIKTPNLDPIITQGSIVQTSWLGLCLAYVQFAFNTGWAGSTAWKAWLALKNKYQNRNWPMHVYFLIWFDGYWDGDRTGHVAIAYDDGKALKIWCSPITNKPYADTWGSIADIEKNYGMTYVGWSGELAGQQLIKQVVEPPKETEVMVDEAALLVLYRFYLGTGISEHGYKHRLGKQTFVQAQREIINSDTAKALLKKRAEEQTGFIEHLPSMYRSVVKLPEQLN